MEDSAFVGLRRLSDWFATLGAGGGRSALSIERLVQRLGPVCVPLLGRELASREPRRREAARAALASLGAASSPVRARAIAELQRIAAGDVDDDGKVCALGLLAELGERGAARFTDPSAIQRRSALALAAQLDGASEIAAAADMMVNQLPGDDLVRLLAVVADASPGAAHRLASELAARLDLDPEQRERIAEVALACDPPAEVPRRAPRPTHVAVLVDHTAPPFGGAAGRAHVPTGEAAARLVVVATRKLPGERRWRRWAVLIDQQGRIEDCVHEDQAIDDAAPLVASLVADGYRVATSDLEHARAVIASAARGSRELPSAYYLGRDLLDLGEAHLGGRTHAHPTSTTLGRAVELIEAGEHARAQTLLARCELAQPDAAAAAAACAFAASQPGDAIAHLARALEAEPDWPLHHWNLAAACHQLGDAAGCYRALCQFLATSARPTGLYADPDQPSRVALASRLVDELERASRLSGTPLPRPRRKRRTARRTARR